MLIIGLVLAALTALHLRAAYRVRTRRLAADHVRQTTVAARAHVDATFAAGTRQMQQLARRRRVNWKEW